MKDPAGKGQRPGLTCGLCLKELGLIKAFIASAGKPVMLLSPQLLSGQDEEKKLGCLSRNTRQHPGDLGEEKRVFKLTRG